MTERLIISELAKGGKRDTTKLTPVQRQVTRNGKTFTQTVYINTDASTKTKEKKASTVDVNKHLRPIRKALGTEKYKEYLRANGITWEKSEHAGADTMRASIAAKKWLEAGNKLDKALYERMLKGESPKPKTVKKKKEDPKKLVVNTLTLKDVKTYDDLKAFGAQNGYKVDLADIPFETAKEVIQTYENVRQKFPQLEGLLTDKYGKRETVVIRNHHPKDGRMKKNWYAFCGDKHIGVNTIFYSDKDSLNKSYEKDTKHGWHPANTEYKSIITHEIGHLVNNQFEWRTQKGIRKDWNKFAREIKAKTLRSLKLKAKDVDKELSTYATTNVREFFAEAFSEWVDSPNPRPVAKEFGRILTEEVNKVVNKKT